MKQINMNLIFSKSIRFHGDIFYTGKINIDKAEINQTNLWQNIVSFHKKLRDHYQKKIEIKSEILSIV